MKDIKDFLFESQESEFVILLNGDDDDWPVTHGFWEWLNSNDIDSVSVKKDKASKINNKFGEGIWDCIDTKDVDKFYKLIEKGVSGFKYSYNGKDYNIYVKCDNRNTDGAYVIVNDKNGHEANITCKNFKC